MKRWSQIVALALVGILTLAPGGLAGLLYQFRGPAGFDGYGLGHLDGKVRIVKASRGSKEWRLEKSAEGYFIRVSSDETIDRHHHWYLSYDPEGKDKTVFLRKDPGPGSHWQVDPNQDKDSLTAAAGKLKGWHLCVGKEAESLKDNSDKPCTAYSVVLARNPRPSPQFKLVQLSK